jgi:hypothetical protein
MVEVNYTLMVTGMRPKHVSDLNFWEIGPVGNDRHRNGDRSFDARLANRRD